MCSWINTLLIIRIQGNDLTPYQKHSSKPIINNSFIMVFTGTGAKSQKKSSQNRYQLNPWPLDILPSCATRLRRKKKVSFRRTGQVRFIFITNRPQGSTFFFFQVFRLGSVGLLTSRTIFGLFFSSINDIDANQVYLFIHKDLGCQETAVFFRIM